MAACGADERCETWRSSKKKRDVRELDAPLGNQSGLIAAILFLVACIAISSADGRAARCADGGTLKCATGLMADDAAEQRSAECASGGSALGVWAGWGSAIGKCDCNKGAGDGKDAGFHEG